MFNNPVFCSALGDLYYATRGGGWNNGYGWSSAAAGTPTNYCIFSSSLANCDGTGMLNTMYVK